MLTAYRVPLGAITPSATIKPTRSPFTTPFIPVSPTAQPTAPRIPSSGLTPIAPPPAPVPTPTPPTSPVAPSNGDVPPAPAPEPTPPPMFAPANGGAPAANGGAPAANGRAPAANGEAKNGELPKPWYKKPVVWGVSAGTLVVIGIAVVILRR